ncbi:MAG: hypothetical protein ABGZ17_26780 [Planctomycetaceae bacterium]
MRNRVSVGCVFVLWHVFCSVISAAEPIEIGARRELFVDQHLIEHLDAAELTLHHPQPREVALRFDQSWEGNTSWPVMDWKWFP